MEAVSTPSRVIFNIPSCQMTSPVVRKRLKTTLSMSSITIARRPRNMKRTGTRDSFITAASASMPMAYPAQSWAQNNMMIYSIVPKSFVLGSSLCITESVG